MIRTVFDKLAALALFGMCGGILAFVVYLLFNIYGFEYQYLWRMLGASGVAVGAFITLEAGYLFGRAARALVMQRYLFPINSLGRLIVIAWVAVLAWAGDWVLLTQNPVSVRVLPSPSTEQRAKVLADAADRLPADLIPESLRDDPKRRAQFVVMLERVAANRPHDYTAEAFLRAAKEYGTKYNVDPILAYYWAYLTSYYGEAPAGSVPFLRAMTSETIRDFVQVHLPSFLVEANWRRNLIEGPKLDGTNFLGHNGNDWKYAIQKATYDVSVEPFDTNVYTDVFLVLREYPAEFPEIFGDDPRKESINVALNDSFKALEPTTFMAKPYGGYYDVPRWQPAQYDELRRPLKTFARAAFYRFSLDIDFATRVQTLIAKYYMDQYRAVLGEATWNSLGNAKQIALVAILRDVYKPNIGKVSSNVYNLPEFNLAPFFFVSEAAKQDQAALVSDTGIWTPKDKEKLWAAADTKLRALSEVWRTYYGAPLPGVQPTETLQDAEDVVVRALR